MDYAQVVSDTASHLMDQLSQPAVVCAKALSKIAQIAMQPPATNPILERTGYLSGRILGRLVVTQCRRLP